MYKSPCKDCENRHIGCHGDCSSYKAWHEEKSKENHWLIVNDFRICKATARRNHALKIYGDAEMKKHLRMY